MEFLCLSHIFPRCSPCELVQKLEMNRLSSVLPRAPETTHSIVHSLKLDPSGRSAWRDGFLHQGFVDFVHRPQGIVRMTHDPGVSSVKELGSSPEVVTTDIAQLGDPSFKNTRSVRLSYERVLLCRRVGGFRHKQTSDGSTDIDEMGRVVESH